MIHPSYSELMQVVNKDTEIDEPPVVNSRYSIVLATSKRARQLIGGDTPLVPHASGKKPLSVAIDELYEGKVKIMAEAPKAEDGQQEDELQENGFQEDGELPGDGFLENGLQENGFQKDGELSEEEQEDGQLEDVDL